MGGPLGDAAAMPYGTRASRKLQLVVLLRFSADQRGLVQLFCQTWSSLEIEGPHSPTNGGFVGQARSQIPFAGGGARNPKLLLARYSRRALRFSPLHPAFVNIRGGAAYVYKPRCVALHCSFGE